MIKTFYFFKIESVCILAAILFFTLNILFANANENEISDFNIYRIQPDLLDSYDVIEKGTTFNVILQNNVYSNESEKNNKVLFKIVDEEDLDLKISGSVSKVSKPGRMSKSGSLGFSADKLYLDDGREVSLSANSSRFNAIHPPHANSNLIGLARTITSLSLAGGPATFGASLGIGFLASGALSAHQNGIMDFFWGGFDGIGLSFVEKIFRKQPELYLNTGSLIPFTLGDDLKVSKGIYKQKLEKIFISDEKALEKIQKLLQWGDLAGALELSIKTGQKEKYEEIMRKISS